MSIVKLVPGSRLMLLNGMTSQLKTNTFNDEGAGSTPTTLISECVGSLPVFGDLTTTDLQNNDFTSLLALEFPSKTIEFYLLDDKCNELSLLNDSTYGVNYPKGFLAISQGFTFFQHLYLGYKLEWRKVLQVHGHGTYKIKKKVTHADLSVDEECSCLFDLCQYTNERANETVRIETIQNGKIIGQGLNYIGMNWQEQIRIKGFFGNKQRRLEQDNYLDRNRNTTQIQDSLIHEFTLEPYFFPECLRYRIDEILLANEILISDYNSDNTDDL